MAQAIRNIKAGQRFEIINVTIGGFDKGCIVEALVNKENIEEDSFAGIFKWVGGFEPNYYNYKNAKLSQSVQDLKRFKGKIK